MKRAVLSFLLCLSAPAHADPPKGFPVVGAYLTLTGASKGFGASTLEGIELAFLEHRARVQGSRIVVETLDTQGKASEAAPVVTRLIDKGSIALIGEVSSSLTIAGAAVAQQHGIPMITPAATSAQVTDAGGMIFRACQTDDAQGLVMARFARDNLKASSVAILDDGQPYATALGDAFSTGFVSRGGRIATKQTYASRATDFEPQLRAIAATRADWVFVPGFYPEVIAIAKQAKQLGIRLRFLGGDGWDTDQLAALAGNALDGSYYVNHFAVDDPRAATRSFVKAFRARYGHAPDVLAALGYDAANVVLGAVAKAKTTSPADLVAAIRATKLAGATGELSFHANDQGVTKSMIVLQIKSGKPRFAATVQP